MKTPRQKYLQDVHYRTIVDTMVAHIDAALFTPSEMREAAILASIIYEESHIRYAEITNPELEMTFKNLYKWANTPAPHNVSINRDKK